MSANEAIDILTTSSKRKSFVMLRMARFVKKDVWSSETALF